MTDTKYAKPALKFDDVPKWFKDMRNSSDFMPSKFNIKPMSYNYMALVETPNRSQAYTPASTRSRIDIGTQYHRPTDNVAKAIKSNQTVWQDIKNLGGEVKEHGGNLLGRALDVPLKKVTRRDVISSAQSGCANPSGIFKVDLAASGQIKRFGEVLEIGTHSGDLRLDTALGLKRCL